MTVETTKPLSELSPGDTYVTPGDGGAFMALSPAPGMPAAPAGQVFVADLRNGNLFTKLGSDPVAATKLKAVPA